jgi:hypothetical protein
MGRRDGRRRRNQDVPLIALAGSDSIALTLVAVILIDIAIQGVNVLNQTRLVSIDPVSQSRLNTAFVVCNFGAIGSMLAGLLWQAGGWSLPITGQTLAILVAVMVWVFNRTKLENAAQGPKIGLLPTAEAL